MLITRLLLLGLALAASLVAFLLLSSRDGRLPHNAGDRRIPLAVLGDSDSHAYHDSILLGDPKLRGGAFRATTLQWTEVLHALRADQIDQGSWGHWGTPYNKVAWLRNLFGMEGRAPSKEDFRFNFALSGAGCESLVAKPALQAQRLLYLMRQDPARWSRGVVVIRLSNNSVGSDEDLDRYAHTGLDEAARQHLRPCVADFRRAYELIRAEHPQTAIVLDSNADDNPSMTHDRWSGAEARSHIASVFDWYDVQLQSVCGSDARCIYHSDRRWFAGLFAAPDVAGHRAYRSLSLGGEVALTNTNGDHPRNVSTRDNHPGTALNALYAKRLIDLLNGRLGFRLRPITMSEVAFVTDPTGRFGLRATGHDGQLPSN